MARNDCKLYVGDLPRDVTEREIEKVFKSFGPIRSVWVARNPPGFAFVEFEDPRDAEDAVKDLDGSSICGAKARVEFSNNGRSRRDSRSQSQSQGARRFDPTDRCYECGEKGHYAYDCKRRGRGSRRSRSRSRSRDRYRDQSRSRSRSKSRSRSRSRKSYSRSKSRSYSR